MVGIEKRALTDKQIIGQLRLLTGLQLQILAVFLLLELRADRDVIVSRLAAL